MPEKRVLHQIRNAGRVLEAYRFTEPLARFLTAFYKANRQMGSSDRRNTSRLCYNYFRLGHAFPDLPLEERLVVADFLGESQSALVEALAPDLHGRMANSLPEKIEYIQASYGSFIPAVFPWTDHLSAGLDREAFVAGLFVQPDLFIRTKRDRTAQVVRVLEEKQVSFRQPGPQTLAMANSTPISTWREISGAFEVQDLCSQLIGSFTALRPGDRWWDCCAASGGKSLMLLDQCPQIDLLVSDVRQSILRNLDERFQQAGMPHTYRKKILDLSHPVSHLMEGEQFDGILIDAPCSGSGTWGRTPERIRAWDMSQISHYTRLQREITKNALAFLKKEGQLVYVTCSVFAEENENITRYIEQELGLRKIAQQLLAGYRQKADSMFVAQFVHPG